MRHAVQLFIPCLVDQLYPEIGQAMVRLLRRLDFDLGYDPRQTCCGQPAFNAGQHPQACQVAGHWLEVFAEAKTVVCPSGSCVAMVRKFMPQLFADPQRAAIVELGTRVFELSEWLLASGAGDRLAGRFAGRIAWHNSCHGLRELGLDAGPLTLFGRIDGLTVTTPAAPTCCGFGGLFSYKYSAVADAMAAARVEGFAEAQTVVTNDPGCLLHLRRYLAEAAPAVEVLHLAEFLDRATANV